MPGSVQAVSQATVRAKLSAEVKRVLVREGDRVTAGQQIAEFDTAQLRAQMAERKATLESARAQLAMAERTRQANAQLVKQNFISQNAFDTADSAHQVQLAAVATAKAQLGLDAAVDDRCRRARTDIRHGFEAPRAARRKGQFRRAVDCRSSIWRNSKCRRRCRSPT